MKVKCHWSAPPSHPPKVRAFGMSTRFSWGILGSKTGKGAENPQPAGDQNEDRNRVQPMAEAHYPGMLERRSDAIIARLLGQAGRNIDRVARTGRPCGKRRLDAAG